MHVFPTCFFAISYVFRMSSLLIHVNRVSLFKLPCSITHYGYEITYSSIHLLMMATKLHRFAGMTYRILQIFSGKCDKIL